MLYMLCAVQTSSHSDTTDEDDIVELVQHQHARTNTSQSTHMVTACCEHGAHIWLHTSLQRHDLASHRRHRIAAVPSHVHAHVHVMC